MRRLIDVVFVEPKHKFFVVLHQGQFWRLPRLHLNKNAWTLKTPYEGSLNDIFVAKDQALACAELTQILKTYDLPKQLHGMNAHWFLDWWNMYDYKWLSTQDVISLDTKASKNTIAQDGQQQSAKSPAQQAPKLSSKADNAKTAPAATESPAPKNQNTEHQASENKNPQTKPAQKQHAQTATASQSSDKPASTQDIFDKLLEELAYDIHHH